MLLREGSGKITQRERTFMSAPPSGKQVTLSSVKARA